MTVKYKDLEFEVKDVNEAGFRRDAYFLIADIYDSFSKFDNPLKAYYDFFFPLKDGVCVPRFKEVFEMFLVGTDGISYEMDKENSDALMQTGREILSFFLPKT